MKIQFATELFYHSFESPSVRNPRWTIRHAATPIAHGCPLDTGAQGVEFNVVTVADEFTKPAADSLCDVTERRNIQAPCLTHYKRKTSEVSSQATKEWIASHMKSRERYCPPKSGTSPPTSERSECSLLSGTASFYQCAP